MVGPQTEKNSVAKLCPCALNDGKTRDVVERRQRRPCRVTVIECDEFQKVMRTTTV